MANVLKHRRRSQRSSHNRIPVAMFSKNAEKAYMAKMIRENRIKGEYEEAK